MLPGIADQGEGGVRPTAVVPSGELHAPGWGEELGLAGPGEQAAAPRAGKSASPQLGGPQWLPCSAELGDAGGGSAPGRYTAGLHGSCIPAASSSCLPWLQGVRAAGTPCAASTQLSPFPGRAQCPAQTFPLARPWHRLPEGYSRAVAVLSPGQGAWMLTGLLASLHHAVRLSGLAGHLPTPCCGQRLCKCPQHRSGSGQGAWGSSEAAPAPRSLRQTRPREADTERGRVLPRVQRGCPAFPSQALSCSQCRPPSPSWTAKCGAAGARGCAHLPRARGE